MPTGSYLIEERTNRTTENHLCLQGCQVVVVQALLYPLQPAYKCLQLFSKKKTHHPPPPKKTTKQQNKTKTFKNSFHSLLLQVLT